jgi:cystathionine gamma-synthase
VHAGRPVHRDTDAVAPPIILSVAFEGDPDSPASDAYHYTTAGNPNRTELEVALAELEGGSDAAAFATGSAAIVSVLRTLAPGDHVLVPDDVFQGTVRLLTRVLARWGIEHDRVDMTSLDSVRAAVRPNTRLLWTEVLSNPLLKVTDVEALARIAKEHEAACAVDNTFVTPVFQQPLQYGVDYVVHASTKYLAGHGDVHGGAVIIGPGAPAAFEDIRQRQWFEGAVPSPFDCWLIRRGLKTLPFRMRAHAQGAGEVARFLETHPAVRRVHYPGLADHPRHDVAARVLSGFGGIVSFQPHGGPAAAMAAAARVRLFTRATSLGMPESLIQHQASAPTHGSGTGLPEDLVRLSIGLEHPDDLIADLDQALVR